MRRRILTAGPVLLAAAATRAAQGRDLAAPLHVAASFSILADLVRVVGGEAVEVESLVPAGTDAHGFQPTPSVARSVAGADIVVLQGLGFDAWLQRLVRASGFRGRQIVASTGVATLRAGVHGHAHAEVDPHLWQDPARAQAMVRTITAGLQAASPSVAEGIERRTEAYIGELRSLESDIAARFQRIPRERRRIVTTHEGFAYFGNRFGVDFLAAQGVTAAAEPSARQMAALIDQIRRLRITAVFLEGAASERAMRRLAVEAGVRIGGTVHADTLALPGQGPTTYLEVMRHNAEAFASALQS